MMIDNYSFASLQEYERNNPIVDVLWRKGGSSELQLSSECNCWQNYWCKESWPGQSRGIEKD